MMMTKLFKLFSHLLIWTVFYLVMLAIVDSLLETVGMGDILNMRLISEISFILLLSLVLPFYIFYFLGQAGLKKSTRIAWNILGVLSIIFLPLGYIILDGQPITLRVYAKMLVLVAFFSMLGYLFRGFLQGLRLKQEKEALQKQLLEAELGFLKGQISPHFLFNTLNNIDALIRINPEEASRSLISMSDIMRYMIYDTKENTVPLKQELYYLESLLSLYNLRFNEDGVVRLTVNGDALSYRIPPMLLLPIAENAFKHHSKKHSHDGILINILIADNKLRLTAGNAYDPDAKKAASSGLGMQTLKRRLDLLYPAKYTLDIHPSSYTFNVTLVIPLTDGDKAGFNNAGAMAVSHD
jgi:two-component system, LytTR family, sensor kinase